MPLTVLNIGYSLAPVGQDVAGGGRGARGGVLTWGFRRGRGGGVGGGGGEQVLSALDHSLVAAGHRSIVVAPEGSQTAGILVATAPLPAAITDEARQSMQQRHREAIAEALARWPVDVIHAHGLDFAEHLPGAGIPTLVRLLLAAGSHPAEGGSPAVRRTLFNCVSMAQQRTFPPLPTMLPPISGGVPVERLQARHAKRDFALALGRVCPEK